MTLAEPAAAQSPRVLVVGRPSAADADTLETTLSAIGPHVQFLQSGSLDALSEEGDLPQIVLVLQRQPDQFTPQQVHRLLEKFPLSRLIVCHGPWCDSDARTRTVWPLACRVPAWDLLSRIKHELAVVRNQAVPLPLTANRDECWLFDYAADAPAARDRLKIAVQTNDPAIAQWLANALETAGHQVYPAPHDDDDVLLWDVDPWTASTADRIAAMRRQQPHLPIVALAGFHRPCEEQTLRAAGVQAVAAKLSPLAELCRVLEEAATQGLAQDRFPRPALHVVCEP